MRRVWIFTRAAWHLCQRSEVGAEPRSRSGALACLATGLCRECVAMMEYDSPLAGEMCEVCEEACEACAEECEKCGDMPCCKKCAEACEKCHDACEAMAE